jgi:thiaminase (transcriptional activator TenA)
VYLKEFSRIFAWAVAKSESLASMSWYASVLNLTLNTEMGLHREYAKRFGISLEDLENTKCGRLTERIRTSSYALPQTATWPTLVAALLPCAWGYVYIGQYLSKNNPPVDQRYGDWIAQYASDEFAEAAEWLKNEMNRLAEYSSPLKKQRLIELFVLSSRYELKFWDMCWDGEEW